MKASTTIPPGQNLDLEKNLAPWTECGLHNSNRLAERQEVRGELELTLKAVGRYYVGYLFPAGIFSVER